ncbi:MAG TPA: oligosaccharide flippase family protein [Candidatus Limnocylindria bacterium]|nr:oligosaccharide flippase family protein [Candidatus Limnocylindria bacterium]
MLALARRYAHAGPALWVLAATTIANVFAYGYQVVMARLLPPGDYAILTALFGVLILESLSAQVIQSATARLAAQYRARDDEPALHVFVRRWTKRILLLAGPPSLVIVVAAPLVGPALSLPVADVVLLGLALFIAAPLTFTGGLLQGLRRFGWFGWYFIIQAIARLAIGVTLVVLGFGVTGAFIGALAALIAGLACSIVPLGPLFRAARGATHAAELGRAETRFFLLASVIMLAYAALTNIDAIASRALLPVADAGAYAGSVTMAKVVLFAPVAVGFILLERTARAHAKGEDTDRALFVALGFVLATSGVVVLAYLLAPTVLTRIVVGDQYALTPRLIGPYALAALLNALLSLWIAHFIGRGEMRFGHLLALAVVAEVVLIVLTPHDAATLVRVVLGVAIATQLAAVGTYAWERGHR